MRLFKAIAIATAVAACSGAANASLLVQYGTAASTTVGNTLPAVFADSSVTADALVAGSGLTANSGATFNWKGWDVASTNFASAVAANDFWSFGFDAVQAIQLTSFDIRLDRSSQGPDNFEIQASVNGGSGTTVLGYDYTDTDLGIDFLGIDLSSIFMNAGDSIVFTMAAFNSESANGTFDLETITYPGGTDGISIYGDVVASPVPLPAAAWFLLSGVAGLAGLARRKSA